MIQLTRLNGHSLVLNSDLITLIENAPDTVITLVNGEKIVVKENNETILGRILEFRRRVLDGLQKNVTSGDPMKVERADAITLVAPPTEEV